MRDIGAVAKTREREEKDDDWQMVQGLLVVYELGPIFGEQTKRGHDRNSKDIVIVD